ncbi:DMT family transporter [Rubneribacter badeniensis]|uniref:EamA family transporter n=1 Tax=Rubneribacter badeniensis TaxID=2070688 RepID=UPI00174BA023
MAGAASLRGAALTLAGAALWGFSGASSQYVLAQGADPTFVTAMRMLCAGALFLAFLAVRRRDVLARVFADRRTVGRFAVFGFGLLGSQITFAISIAYTNAGTATVLQMTGSVFIMLFVCLRARTAPRTGEALGLAAALAATYLIATQGDFGALRLPVEGVLWGVANGLAVALYVVYPKESGLFERFGGLATTGLGMAVGAVYATIVWLVRAIISLAAGDGAEALRIVAPPLDASGWAVLAIGVGVVGTFVAYALYLSGVARVGSVAGGLLGAVEPLAATSLSAVWLGTAFSGADWAGFALMLAMIALVTIKGPKARTDAAGKGADQAG